MGGREGGREGERVLVCDERHEVPGQQSAALTSGTAPSPWPSCPACGSPCCGLRTWLAPDRG